MYCTPCARLMKSITPNTSVSPAAMRKSSTPSWSPLRVWTRRRAVDIRGVASAYGSIVARMKRSVIRERPPRITLRSMRATVLPLASLHLAVLRVRIAVVGEHLLRDLRLVLAVGALGDLDQVEILDRIVVAVELERAAQRLEVRLG